MFPIPIQEWIQIFWRFSLFHPNLFYKIWGISLRKVSSWFILSSDVNEAMLYEIFNHVGPVASIRVCRDAKLRRSLGYAYVNFVNVQDGSWLLFQWFLLLPNPPTSSKMIRSIKFQTFFSIRWYFNLVCLRIWSLFSVPAERALDTLNSTLIKGRPCRIMWSQRDPSIRKSGIGNIFIKNLDPSIGHKELHDTFSLFGNILSCKVATDENGKSKGYGFVHFENAESAEKAISKLNGMMIGTKKVYVGPFMSRKERERLKESSWTNVFVKEIPPEHSTKEGLEQLFKVFTNKQTKKQTQKFSFFPFFIISTQIFISFTNIKKNGSKVHILLNFAMFFFLYVGIRSHNECVCEDRPQRASVWFCQLWKARRRCQSRQRPSQ